MSRFGLPTTLAAIALLLMFTVNPDDVPPMPLLTLLIMGLSLACAYDVAVEDALRLRRRPTWRDAGLLLLCLPIALATLSAVELLLPLHWRLAWGADRGTIDRIEWSLRLIAFAAPLIPVLAVATVPRHPRGTRPPLWPLLAATGACAFGWIGGGFAWLVMGRPLIDESWTALQATVAAPPTLAAAALPLGIAVQFWWRALRDRGAPRFDGTGMFADVVAATMTGLLIGLLPIFAFVLPLSPAEMRFKAVVLAAWLIVPTTAAWLLALRRIRRMEPTSGFRPVIAIAVMLVAIPLSFAPPLVLLDTGDWAELFLLLATPFTVASCAIVSWMIPRMVASALHVSPPAWPGRPPQDDERN